MVIKIPYGKTEIKGDIPGQLFLGRLLPKSVENGNKTQEQLVAETLESPISSDRLENLAAGKKHVLVIASDHTRPVPSRYLIPPMLERIRKGSPDAEIVILIATGCHRQTSKDELRAKFGEEIFEHETIEVHDCDDESRLKDYGLLPSGGKLRLNSRLDWADLVVAEGFIEPHFFAGFSGGRKAILPGIAARETVMYNHNAAFIKDEKARTGILEGNPIHRDMIAAMKKSGLAFILNVALNGEKKIIGAWAGDPEKAHEQGCRFVAEHFGVSKKTARTPEIVITSNGGYPLDQNIYQTVKGMTAAEACVRQGGVIILCAECEDGHGGEFFFRQCSQPLSPEEIGDQIGQVPPEKTEPDQWQSQIFVRVLKKARVILVTEEKNLETARKMHMKAVTSLQEAIMMALGMTQAGEILVIPDGVGVIPR